MNCAASCSRPVLCSSTSRSLLRTTSTHWFKPQDFKDALRRRSRARNEVVKGRVLTTNESPPSEPIPFHHEMSQVPNPPAYIMFYCDVPPESGETPRNRRRVQAIQAISAEFAERLEDTGVRYVRVMPGTDDDSSPIGRSWRSASRRRADDAEERSDRNGVEVVGQRRAAHGDPPCPQLHGPPKRQKTFFNSVVAAYTNGSMPQPGRNRFDAATTHRSTAPSSWRRRRR